MATPTLDVTSTQSLTSTQVKTNKAVLLIYDPAAAGTAQCIKKFTQADFGTDWIVAADATAAKALLSLVSSDMSDVGTVGQNVFTANLKSDARGAMDASAKYITTATFTTPTVLTAANDENEMLLNFSTAATQNIPAGLVDGFYGRFVSTGTALATITCDVGFTSSKTSYILAQGMSLNFKVEDQGGGTFRVRVIEEPVRMNLTATADPTSANDATEGYIVGSSFWFNTASGALWFYGNDGAATPSPLWVKVYPQTSGGSYPWTRAAISADFNLTLSSTAFPATITDASQPQETVVTVPPNKTYEFRALYSVTAPTTCGVQYRIRRGNLASSTAAVEQYNTVGLATELINETTKNFGGSDTVNTSLWIRFKVDGGASGDQINIEWAQKTATADQVIIRQRSALEYRDIT